MTSSPSRRSPVPHSPLRQPGEATRERGWTDFLVRTAFAFGFVSALCTWAFVAWVFFARGVPLSPWWPTVFALVSAGVVGARTYRDAGPVIRALRGARGEREVGEHLAALAARGYRAFHNLEFPRRDGQGTFDVDHVLVGPAGVFALETKYASKPPRGGKVRYDGSRVLVNGHAPDRDPLAQSKASANAVAEVLRERTGQPVKVRPVVLYPGWYVEAKSGAAVWVLNPKMLAGWLTQEERDGRWSPEQIEACCKALEREARAAVPV